ncbi:AMMECR1 domain-containing protein [Vampirovibrio chlorellavorus]|uniref:AMMECR1 domain-containing protein n=1 Tax=Vampirovibrio chlorellavorus TaxID=758823 RepID=UPI0026EB4B20|nr:AMMECR1 domain-containing protein [Vampirovibrio chlorellavorus]
MRTRQSLVLGLLMSLLCGLAHADTLTPTQLVQKTGQVYFSNHSPSAQWNALALSSRLNERYSKPRGVFVTLSRNGKPRACWGSAYPQYKTVSEATVYATLGALSKEYRYPPIRESEWPLLQPQVTVVKALQPVNRLAAINPLRDGLMVRQGGKAGVMLPGEARDANYMLVQAKLKAGIAPNEKFQLYRIVADVYQ